MLLVECIASIMRCSKGGKPHSYYKDKININIIRLIQKIITLVTDLM